MSIQELVSEVQGFFENVLQKEAHVIGVERRESGWFLQVETVEDSDYMRQRALDDVIGLYEVEVSANMEIVAYRRTALRERDQIEPKNDEE